ncbi:gas vesicle protein GvpA/GvpJ/GvpM family [Kribbella pratensis]|uniref:Gas vesicle protein A n=1 Tax=Kribbella pratensis TaxID=2512112 RepID=A0ABY2FIU4_9ACTN|nr:gas vesicle protein GvpJ [Kribbella pratensis]TDW90851.1 gas vesicle protein GvpA/GvpJ/GvpM family [Kribbella pratensis]
MTVAATGQRRSGGYLDRPAPSSLADVIDSILDKGLVIDAYIRVSLVGIELLTIDARIVVASVDTYLHFAEATNRLDLAEKSKDLPEVIQDMTESGAQGKTRGLLSGAKEALFGSDEDQQRDRELEQRDRGRDQRDREMEQIGEREEPEYEEEAPPRRRRPAKKAAARRRRTEE